MISNVSVPGVPEPSRPPIKATASLHSHSVVEVAVAREHTVTPVSLLPTVTVIAVV